MSNNTNVRHSKVTDKTTGKEKKPKPKKEPIVEESTDDDSNLLGWGLANEAVKSIKKNKRDRDKLLESL